MKAPQSKIYSQKIWSYSKSQTSPGRGPVTLDWLKSAYRNGGITQDSCVWTGKSPQNRPRLAENPVYCLIKDDLYAIDWTRFNLQEFTCGSVYVSIFLKMILIKLGPSLLKKVAVRYYLDVSYGVVKVCMLDNTIRLIKIHHSFAHYMAIILSSQQSNEFLNKLRCKVSFEQFDRLKPEATHTSLKNVFARNHKKAGIETTLRLWNVA